MLNRMFNDGIIDKLARPHATLDYQWCLIKRPRIKALKIQNYEHERACGDVYVSCKLADLNWTYYPRDFAQHEIYPDRKTILDDKTVYWEIDMGTEPLSTIEEKVKNYIKVSSREKMFTVVFVTTTRSRADSILEILETYKRGSQFVVTIFEWIKTDVSNPIFVSPIDIDTPKVLTDIL